MLSSLNLPLCYNIIIIHAGRSRILPEVRNAYITDKTDHEACAQLHDTETNYEQAELVENGHGINGTSIDLEVLVNENVVQYDTPHNQISVSDDVAYGARANEVPI
jgi:hypothetical protein